MTGLVQNGDTINYTTTGAVSLHALIVLTDMVGVAMDTAAASGETLALNTTGVYQISKTPSAANDFTQGDSVYVTGAGAITNVSTSNTLVGKAWASAATGDSTVTVKLNV